MVVNQATMGHEMYAAVLQQPQQRPLHGRAPVGDGVLGSQHDDGPEKGEAQECWWRRELVAPIL